jgi:hypothetical protein
LLQMRNGDRILTGRASVFPEPTFFWRLVMSVCQQNGWDRMKNWIILISDLKHQQMLELTGWPFMIVGQKRQSCHQGEECKVEGRVVSFTGTSCHNLQTKNIARNVARWFVSEIIKARINNVLWSSFP